LIITGPCSIDDSQAAIEYAEKLKELQEEVKDNIYLVMRTYFEKPRTTIGWKGLISDPEGLIKARKLLKDITELGVPCASEFVGTYIHKYIEDFISWAAIGARNNQSQPHREFVSDLKMPVGFKNSTEGGIKTSVNSITAAGVSQDYFGIDDDGMVSWITGTTGNKYTHLILRGSYLGPNYDENSVRKALELLSDAKQRKALVIDCSHDNSIDPKTSKKDYKRQSEVALEVINQRLKGNKYIVALMLESYLVEGSGNLYGQSKTDKCLGWNQTKSLIKKISQMLNDKLL
jgi:3-deoxy-7-phosphoheptulonate synthase